MRHKNLLIAAIMIGAGGLILVPSPQESSARQFKQLAIAVINYQGSVEPPNMDRLMAEEGDASVGMLMTEDDEVYEAAAVQPRGSDVVYLQIDTGEIMPAVVLRRDGDLMLVMDAGGNLKLYIAL